ncbi:pilus assembly protein, partial [Francisella tularensis subsp. holarctica]|nr:pilus assembly protein [Francisella tularensis subsp. holarctica]
MLLQQIKSQEGFGIVESMLASLILLFVLSSVFLLLNSVLVNITIENKKDEIATILDERVSIYRLNGVFDDTKTKVGIEFIITVV